MRRAVASALAVLVLAVGCAEGGDAELQTGTPATPSSSSAAVRECFDASYEPLGEGETIGPDQCPEPSPGATATWTLTDAFLPPDLARQAEAGTTSADPVLGDWAVRREAEAEPGPVLDPCGDGGFSAAGAVAASDERTIGWQDEASGSEVVQEVFRYASAREAEQAFAGYADAVERCPELDDPQGESSVEHATVQRDAVDGVQRLLVRRQPCMAPGACTAHFASYYVVAQVADGLTAAHYGIFSDGDPAEAAKGIRDAVARRLGQAVQG